MQWYNVKSGYNKVKLNGKKNALYNCNMHEMITRLKERKIKNFAQRQTICNSIHQYDSNTQPRIYLHTFLTWYRFIQTIEWNLKKKKRISFWNTLNGIAIDKNAVTRQSHSRNCSGEKLWQKFWWRKRKKNKSYFSAKQQQWRCCYCTNNSKKECKKQ